MTATMFPTLAVEQVDVAEVNRYLAAWAHPLGPCRRPFGNEAHLMLLDGRPVAATISSSIVSPTVAGHPRRDVVELARIARDPATRWVMRPMLRIWRAHLAPQWSYWPVRVAVSYALPGYSGDIYRFDGWRRVGPVKRSGGGGNWSRRPKVNDLAGDKTLWLFEYEAGAEG
jgi:hypothetical protein